MRNLEILSDQATRLSAEAIVLGIFPVIAEPGEGPGAPVIIRARRCHPESGGGGAAAMGLGPDCPPRDVFRESPPFAPYTRRGCKSLGLVAPGF